MIFWLILFDELFIFGECENKVWVVVRKDMRLKNVSEKELNELIFE